VKEYTGRIPTASEKIDSLKRFESIPVSSLPASYRFYRLSLMKSRLHEIRGETAYFMKMKHCSSSNIVAGNTERTVRCGKESKQCFNDHQMVNR
jgi:hypothetical protein